MMPALPLDLSQMLFVAALAVLWAIGFASGNQ